MKSRRIDVINNLQYRIMYRSVLYPNAIGTAELPTKKSDCLAIQKLTVNRHLTAVGILKYMCQMINVMKFFFALLFFTSIQTCVMLYELIHKLNEFLAWRAKIHLFYILI